VRKLRRLSDFVCCLLPFEEPFFERHDVPARFVGHPLFDRVPDPAELAERASAFPGGERRIALMPGSRPAEIEKNFPLLIEAYRRIRRNFPDVTGVVAGARDGLEAELRAIADRTPHAPGCEKGWPDSLVFVSGQTDAVIHWSTLALVVSGTVTLQVARQARPMVVVYKSSRLVYHLLARWLVRTPHYSLPNLVAGERIVPELMPHFGGPEAIVDKAVELLERLELADAQRRRLEEVAARFAGHNAARGAADAIERVAGLPAAGARRDAPEGDQVAAAG